MSAPRVTLVTSADYPNLEQDDAGLIPALRQRGMDPHIEVWDDPHVDWDKAGVCVVRSVRDYAAKREQFVAWAHSVPKLLNPADATEWGTDKHYLIELSKLGMPIVPTTWLEPAAKLSKKRVHTRFPALGDMVVKPAVSSGGREIGRYTANSGVSRTRAIESAMRLLDEGRCAMVQRYMEQVDTYGEISLIYFNGILSHAVQKRALLNPREETGEKLHHMVFEAHKPSSQEWEWGEQATRAIHRYIRARLGHDQQLLFCRVDLVPDGKGGCVIMEIAVVDANLYLSKTRRAAKAFADAIGSRVFW